MKALFSVAIATFFTLASFAQAIPNNSFENWTNTNGYNTPDNWMCLNDYTAALNTFTCMRGTPGTPGMYYMKLVSKNVAGLGVVPGVAVCGSLNLSNFTAIGGFPFTFRPTSFDGKWQYMGASTSDVGMIEVLLTHFDSATGVRDTVGRAYHDLFDMEMSWVNFSFPFTYYNTNTPDSCIIYMNASGAAPEATSYLYVDNLSFSIPTNNEELSADADFNLYPNPASTNIALNLPAYFSNASNVRVYNALGQFVVEQQAHAGLNNLDIANLPNGLYYLVATSEQHSKTLQFEKK